MSPPVLRAATSAWWYCALNAEHAWHDATHLSLSAMLARGVVPGGGDGLECLLGFGSMSDAQLVRQRPVDALLQLYRDAGNADEVLTVGEAALHAARNDVVLNPFAVTPHTIEVALTLGLAEQLSALEVVRTVNSKKWSTLLRNSLGLGYSDRHVETIADFVEVSDQCLAENGAFVVKEDFGVAGRGSLVVRGRSQCTRLLSLMAREVDRGKKLSLTVEPWLDRHLDFSACARVDRTGALEWLGLSGMVNQGTSYGLSHSLSEEVTARVMNDSSYTDAVRAVGSALHAAGYFGPFCVDSMVTTSGGTVPIVEVNARASMGMLNLAQHGRNPHAAFAAYLSVSVSGSGASFSRALCALADRRLVSSAGRSSHVGMIPLGLENKYLPSTEEGGLRFRSIPWLHCCVLYDDRGELRGWIESLEGCMRDAEIVLGGRGLEALKSLC